jgi:hypothetical protein
MSPIFDEQRCLTGSGYDGSVVRVEAQINVAGRQRYVVYIQIE